ncbi:MAG TPA: hypothetical protein VN785_12215 [Candidatus Angelobacter sp.]|nr:hypothetical protein [Candidatus Angelobacter sp.]
MSDPKSEPKKETKKFSELEGHVDGRVLKVFRELDGRIARLEPKPAQSEAPKPVDPPPDPEDSW